MKVVWTSALRTGRLCPQKVFLVLISVTDCVESKAMVRLEGLCRWKSPITPSVIGPATFLRVAQFVNQLRHPVAPLLDVPCSFSCQLIFHNDLCETDSVHTITMLCPFVVTVVDLYHNWLRFKFLHNIVTLVMSKIVYFAVFPQKISPVLLWF
jgi:hypothetical protein